MKKYLLPALKLSLVLLVICSLLYPLLIAAVGRFAPDPTVSAHGRVVGYVNLGQRFTDDKYFWSRPSAAAYNATGGSGSNKGPSNPDYLKDVQAHIDTFLVHNPGVRRQDIPAELVTYSGSGLDPDLSPDAALIQVARVAHARGLSDERVRELVSSHIQGPLLGLFGPPKVNVLKLNIALDDLK
jgi:K+-transporting ATPase ATPase C chain